MFINYLSYLESIFRICFHQHFILFFSCMFKMFFCPIMDNKYVKVIKFTECSNDKSGLYIQYRQRLHVKVENSDNFLV